MLTRIRASCRPCAQLMFAAQSIRMCSSKAAPMTFMELYHKASEEFRLGHLSSAASLSKDALSVSTDLAAVKSKDIAAVELNLAHILKLLSQFQDAKLHAEKGLKLLDSTFSSNKAEVCHALDVVAELSAELGELKHGLTAVERSIEVKSRIFGPAAPILAKSYNIRGALHAADNHLAQARSDYIRALAINVRAHGRARPLPLPIGITLSNIASVLRTEGNRANECVALYRAVVSSFEAAAEKTPDTDSWLVGAASTDLAEALLEADNGDLAEAKLLLTQSLHAFLSTRGLDHPSTVRASMLLKQCARAAEAESEPKLVQEESDFVETLLDECEKVVPKSDTRISGEILFLDRRGHVGHGHPHSRLF